MHKLYNFNFSNRGIVGNIYLLNILSESDNSLEVLD